MLLSDVCLSDVCLSNGCLTSDVCLSRTSSPSREERGLGRTKSAHVTRDSDTTFKVKRSKVKVIIYVVLSS